jgi:hypothetical protein
VDEKDEWRSWWAQRISAQQGQAECIELIRGFEDEVRKERDKEWRGELGLVEELEDNESPMAVVAKALRTWKDALEVAEARSDKLLVDSGSIAAERDGLRAANGLLRARLTEAERAGAVLERVIARMAKKQGERSKGRAVPKVKVDPQARKMSTKGQQPLRQNARPRGRGVR